MPGTIGNWGINIEFRTDPFYLYPINESLIGNLFINREEEIKIARGILETKYITKFEICAVIGGIGVGKSSMLYYLMKLADKMGYDVFHFGNVNKFYSDAKSIEGGNIVYLIDDIDKLNDVEVSKSYTFIEEFLNIDGGIIFFSDIYDRNNKTLILRNFTVSQNISLPKNLPVEKLQYFLQERMRKCLVNVKKFSQPFDKGSLEMAGIRSAGNLRNFLNYTKNAYMLAVGSKRKTVNIKDMKDGIIIIDRTFLGSCDMTDLRILWYATIGEMNKTYLAHKCGIDVKTLDSRIEDRLVEIILTKRSGKDIIITSVYNNIKDGKEID